MDPLLVVTGPPGAGKSTVTRVLADRATPSVLVAGDAFFGFLASGATEPWRPEADHQNEVVTRAAAAAAGTFARDGYNTFYDGVIGPWFLQTFASATRLAQFDYVVVLPPASICVRRVAARQGHGFTDIDATRAMHSEFAQAEVEDRHVITDPPNELDALIRVIADRRAAGALRYTLP